MNLRKTIMLAALLLVVAALPTTAQPPGCEVVVGTISALGITVVPPEPSGVCRTVDPGSLSATSLAECAVVLGRITAPAVEVNEPGEGQLPGGGSGGADGYCLEGSEFTITVPVNTRGNTVQYRWYRDGTLIPGAQGTLTANGNAITYTVPEDEAYGDDEVVFHFMYTLSDDCDAWTMSDGYALRFWVPAAFCRDIDPGSLSGQNVLTCAVTVGRIDAPEVIVTPPVPPDVCRNVDAGSLSGIGVPVCAVTVGRLSAPEVIVVEPTAARAGIFGFFGRLFN